MLPEAVIKFDKSTSDYLESELIRIFTKIKNTFFVLTIQGEKPSPLIKYSAVLKPNKTEWVSFAFLVKSENKEITTQPIRFVSLCDRIPIKTDDVFIYFCVLLSTQKKKESNVNMPFPREGTGW